MKLEDSNIKICIRCVLYIQASHKAITGRFLLENTYFQTGSAVLRFNRRVNRYVIRLPVTTVSSICLSACRSVMQHFPANTRKLCHCHQVICITKMGFATRNTTLPWDLCRLVSCQGLTLFNNKRYKCQCSRTHSCWDPLDF